jgi:tetratricopeptide (TPR) repeat protein
MRSKMKLLSTIAAPAVLSLALLFSAPTVAAAASDDPLAKRLAMVHTLLFDSSAAKQIEKSGAEPALAKRREAIDIYEKVVAGGDIETRRAQLNQAVAMLYEAVGLVSNGAGGEQKDLRDFENRQSSLDALLAAHERIMKEKGKSQLHTLLLTEIEEDTAMADSLMADGRIEEARVYLDKAYEVTMLSVEHSRTGETLTRELKFDTPRDEYAYELDRNDTHRMLVTMLLKDKLENKNTQNRIAGFMEAADSYRDAALKHADAGNFDEAIGALELSTGQLVKAIRGAGVYIPG